jgi:uncharacterized cupin superfamily protein
LERGDVVCFPAGPAGAHQVINRSESPARTLMFSSSRAPAVSVYPDSDKIGVWPGDSETTWFLNARPRCRGRRSGSKSART